MSLTDIAGKLIQLSTPLQSRQQDLEKVKGAFTQGLSSVMQPDIKDISTGEYKYTPYVFKLAKDIADNDKTGSITWKPKLDQYIKARDEFNSLNTTDYNAEIKQLDDTIKSPLPVKSSYVTDEVIKKYKQGKQDAKDKKAQLISDQKKLIAKKKEMDRKLNIFKLSLPKRSELEKLHRDVGGAGVSGYGGSGGSGGRTNNYAFRLKLRKDYHQRQRDLYNDLKINKLPTTNIFSQAYNNLQNSTEKAKFNREYNTMLHTIIDMYTGGTDKTFGVTGADVFTQTNADDARNAILGLMSMNTPDQKVIKKASEYYVGADFNKLSSSLAEINKLLSMKLTNFKAKYARDQKLGDKVRAFITQNKEYADKITDPKDVINNTAILSMFSSKGYEQLKNAVLKRYSKSPTLQRKALNNIVSFMKNTLTPTYKKVIGTEQLKKDIADQNKLRKETAHKNAQILAKISKGFKNVIKFTPDQIKTINKMSSFFYNFF